MSRYIFGILAVIIAIGAVAFKTPEKKKYATKLFRYTAPGSSFAQADVQTKSNWQYVAGAQNCSANPQERACEMLVDDVDIDPGNTLNAGFAISASQYSSTGVYYVNSVTSSGTTTIHNKVY